MASSQIEIALTSPFGYVLRKYNHRDRFRESASSHRVSSSPQGTFQNNDTSFVNVIGHHHHHHNVAAQGDVTKNNIDNSNVGSTKKEKEDESLSSTTNSNDVNPRQSQILDRWAARKAKEMVSTIETEAELLENMGSNNSTSTSSSSETTTSNNRGALSLVQIWEKRLNNLNQSLKCNTNATSRASSLGSSDVGEIFTDESSTPSSYSDSVASDTNNEATTCSTPKVADIIKRLKENNNYSGQEQSNNSNNNDTMMMMTMGSSCLSSSRSEQGQHNTSVVHSPRIRGRQALTDLLMQMERDRHGELNNLAQLAPVSNFSRRGRGRIQSLLRLRLLKRHHDQSTKYEVMNRPTRGSSIGHLRERFNIEMKQGSTTTQPETASPRNSHPDQPENPLPPHKRAELGLNPGASGRVVDVRSGYQNASDDSLVASTAHKPESQTNEEEAHASSSETAVCLEEAQDVIASREVAETSSCNNMADSDSNHDETKDEVDQAEVKQMDISAEIEIINYVVDEATMNITEGEGEEEDHDQYASEGNDYDVDDEQNYDDDEEHYYDWISPIARPRSYWEDRRQAWYKEMLGSASSDNKGEIRQLLQRRTVSSFLSSDMRERMDKLMECHIGTQTQFMSSVQENDEDSVGRMGQLMLFLQQHVQPHGHNIEEEEDDEEPKKQEAQEQEEEESLMNDQSSSSSSTKILNSSSRNMQSWSYRDNEASDDPDDRVDEATATATATSTQPSSRSQSFYQHSRQSSSSIINPHSMEMDLIYDMRGKMEHMHREIAEIRKSLKSCVDMQMMLQKSMKREVSRALREKKKKKKKTSNDHQKAQKKGNCCICCDKKVDSLLYRCGHMCTCMKCANELQWNSGKCPMCRAPIADVVRVYVDA